MIRLTTEEYDEAASVIARALFDSRDMKTNLGKALVILEALAEDYEIQTLDKGERFDLPLATDEADAFITDLNDRLTEQRANGLLEWSQGVRP